MSTTDALIEERSAESVMAAENTNPTKESLPTPPTPTGTSPETKGGVVREGSVRSTGTEVAERLR